MPQNKLELLLERLERPRTIATMFDDLRREDPKTARQLAEAFADSVGLLTLYPATGTSQVSSPHGESMTAWDLIVDTLVASNNTAMTKVELQELGISESNLHSIIYTTHRDDLIGVKDPAGGRGRAYRLTNQVYAEVKEDIDNAMKVIQ